MIVIGKNGCVVYLVVKVSVEGVFCCVFFDIGVGSLYVLVVFLDKFFKCFCVKEICWIEMMFGVIMCEVEFFIIKVCLIEGSEELSVDVIRVERGELLRINNFYY